MLKPYCKEQKECSEYTIDDILRNAENRRQIADHRQNTVFVKLEMDYRLYTERSVNTIGHRQNADYKRQTPIQSTQNWERLQTDIRHQTVFTKWEIYYIQYTERRLHKIGSRLQNEKGEQNIVSTKLATDSRQIPVFTKVKTEY